MKLVCISDTHNKMKRLIDEGFIEDGDVFIHCGDATGTGRVEELATFNFQISRLKHAVKIFVPGNHDTLLERSPGLARQMLSAFDHILIDEEVEIEGYKFYGSPWTPRFYNWAFNSDRGEQIRGVWEKIPLDTNVLITHGPPYGILDKVSAESTEHLGCEELRSKIDKLDLLKLATFGHIHGSNGKEVVGKKTFINAAAMNESYDISNGSKTFILE